MLSWSSFPVSLPQACIIDTIVVPGVKKRRWLGTTRELAFELEFSSMTHCFSTRWMSVHSVTCTQRAQASKEAGLEKCRRCQGPKDCIATDCESLTRDPAPYRLSTYQAQTLPLDFIRPWARVRWKIIQSACYCVPTHHVHLSFHHWSLVKWMM